MCGSTPSYSKLYQHMGMRSSNSEPAAGWFSQIACCTLFSTSSQKGRMVQSVAARSGATAPITRADLRSRNKVVSVKIHDYSDPGDQNRISALEPARGGVRKARLEGLCGNK